MNKNCQLGVMRCDNCIDFTMMCKFFVSIIAICLQAFKVIFFTKFIKIIKICKLFFN